MVKSNPSAGGLNISGSNRELACNYCTVGRFIFTQIILFVVMSILFWLQFVKSIWIDDNH